MHEWAVSCNKPDIFEVKYEMMNDVDDKRNAQNACILAVVRGRAKEELHHKGMRCSNLNTIPGILSIEFNPTKSIRKALSIQEADNIHDTVSEPLEDGQDVLPFRLEHKVIQGARHVACVLCCGEASTTNP